MKTIDFSYFIERYITDEMSDTEKNWFEKELEGNEKLRNEVLLRKKTDNILKNQDIISLRSKLARIEKERKAVKPGPRFGRTTITKYAAVVSIIILIGSLSLFHERNLNIDELLTTYDIPYQPSAGSRSMQLNSNEDFAQGLEYYNTSDYRNAANFFNKVVENNPKDMAATLLNGISNYEITRYSEAKESFGKVVEDNKSLYVDQAEWYLAVCYLRTEENDKAVRMLERIKEEGGHFAKPAASLMRKLK